MADSFLVKVGGGFCCFLVVGIVILLVMSFATVETRTFAIKYNKVSRKFSDGVIESGTKLVGPGMDLVRFSEKQLSVTVATEAWSRDSIEVRVSATMFYTLNKAEVLTILERFGSQDAHEEFLNFAFESMMKERIPSFTAKEYYLDRQNFTKALQDTAIQEIAQHQITVETVQVQTVTLPPSILKEMQDSTTAQQDIGTAQSERAAQIQNAANRLQVASNNRTLTLQQAQLDVNVINEQTRQLTAALEDRMKTRTDSFELISAALGNDGGTFVQTYLRNLVLQSNKGEAVITLDDV